MATKPLKSIKFPGLADTYTVTQLDDAAGGMGTQGKAPDSKAVKDAVDELKEDLSKKANIDGYYETLGAGYTRQIQSNMYEEDAAAYNFRTAGGTAEIGELKNEKIVGGSLVWNQLVHHNASTSETNGVTFTNNGDGTWTLDGEATANATKAISDFKLVAGHRYLLTGIPSGGSATTFRAFITFVGSFYSDTIFSYIESVNSAVNIGTISGYTASNLVYKPQLFDLTAMFGSTIADYIYSLEKATAGAGVAWFRRYFPKDYYEYHPVGFEHTQVSKHKTVGFNAFDPIAYKVGGTYNPNIGSVMNFNQTGASASGENPIVIDVTTAWKGISFIAPVFEGMAYQFNCKCSAPTGANIKVSQYLIDENDVVVSSPYNFNGDSTYNINRVFTPSRSGLRCVVHVASASVQKISVSDLCFHLVWDGERDGEYEEYNVHEYALDPVALRGIPKIDESGNLYFEGDEYTPDGTVTRKYGIVDLGTLEWTLRTTGTTNKLLSSTLPFDYKDKGLDILINAICDSYEVHGASSAQALINRIETASVGFYSYNAGVGQPSKTVYLVLPNPVSPTGNLVYELATSATEEADTYTDPMFVDNWGTEEFVDAVVEAGERDVAIPVGHETKYQMNLRAKIESTPDAPPSDGLWLVQMDSGQASYVQYISPIPTLPTDNGNYTLKCAVSGSTKMLSWEAQE